MPKTLGQSALKFLLIALSFIGLVWGHPTDPSFDDLSLVEIHLFNEQLSKQVEVLASLEGLDGLDQNQKMWIALTQTRLWQNVGKACINLSKTDACRSWKSLSDFQQEFSAPLHLRSAESQVSAEEFYQQYAKDLLRLARLFPKVSSEIMTVSDTEVLGWNLPDKHFLLTFDDGPAAATTGILATLNQHQVSAFFFLSTDRLISQPLPNYASHCIGNHGWQHKALPRVEDWEKSISKSFEVLASKQFTSSWFRPPYGERTQTQVAFIQKHFNNRMMLWNIDSQDWRSTATVQSIADRVTRLMLLWRSGIILFHDTLMKNGESLDLILTSNTLNQVIWLNCHQFK